MLRIRLADARGAVPTVPDRARPGCRVQSGAHPGLVEPSPPFPGWVRSWRRARPASLGPADSPLQGRPMHLRSWLLCALVVGLWLPLITALPAYAEQPKPPKTP